MSIKNVFIISHRRSGTHFMIDTLLNNFSTFDEYVNLDQLLSTHHDHMDLEEFTRKLNGDPKIIKTHMHINIDNFFEKNKEIVEFVKKLLNNSKIIYIHRDGRDVLVSLYYFMKRAKIHAATVKGINFSDFIRMKNEFESYSFKKSLNRVEFWAYHVSGWFNQKQYNVHYVSFENLKNNYFNELMKIGDYIDLKPEKVKFVERSPNAEFKNRRYIGPVIETTYKLKAKYLQKTNYTTIGFRKGIIGDYKNHFTEKDLDFFNRYTKGINACI